MSEFVIHDRVRTLAVRGEFDANDLLALRLPVDFEHVVAAAWDLVEDGELTYGADAIFRATGDEQ